MAKKKTTSRTRKPNPKADTVDLKPILPIIHRMLRTSRHVTEAERTKVLTALLKAKD